MTIITQSGSHQKASLSKSRSPPRQSSRPRELFAEPPQTVFLIRHGESLAQTFPLEKRSKDQSLRDCALSPTGEHQAIVLPSILGLDRYRHIDVVVSSPLTRALQTSVLGFPSKHIIINYDLMEIGRDKNPMPENRARPIAQVVADTGGESRVDADYFAPTAKKFPESHERKPSAIRKTIMPKVWKSMWDFCNRRKYQQIAVVCHFNVIRLSLGGNPGIKPQNALPIECCLYRDGSLELVDVLTDQVQEMADTLATLKRRNKWCMGGSMDKEDREQNEQNQAKETN